MIFALIVCGLGAGILSAFFGVGGGVIIVPTLYFLFPAFPPTMVIGSSLGVIFVNSVLNSYLFHRQGKLPDFKTTAYLGVSMGLGSFLGMQIAQSLDANTIKILLALLLLSVATRMFFKKVSKDSELTTIAPKMHWLLALTGLVAGFVSGMSGLGGGAILVPVLILVLKLSVKNVPAFSNVAMAFAALVGVIKASLIALEPNSIPYQQFCFGHVHLLIVVIIFIGSFFGANIGIYLNRKVQQRKAELFFCLLLLLTSSRMLYNVFSH